jgi:hypothetical protein
MACEYHAYVSTARTVGSEQAEAEALGLEFQLTNSPGGQE